MTDACVFVQFESWISIFCISRSAILSILVFPQKLTCSNLVCFILVTRQTLILLYCRSFNVFKMTTSYSSFYWFFLMCSFQFKSSSVWPLNDLPAIFSHFFNLSIFPDSIPGIIILVMEMDEAWVRVVLSFY